MNHELAAGRGPLRSAHTTLLRATAYAFAALALTATGQRDDAQAALREAADRFRQLVDSNTSDLGPGWHDFAVFEAALREARSDGRAKTPP